MEGEKINEHANQVFSGRITKAPDTLKVIQGEEPDLSGGLVEVEFSDGSVKEFPMTEMSVIA